MRPRLLSQRSALNNDCSSREPSRSRARFGRGLAAALLAFQLGAGSCNVLDRDCSMPEVICIGLVTGYGSVATGIEQQAWLALQDARANRVVHRIDFIETIDTRDRAANIAYFADRGYDIIVTTGAGIAVETVAAAEQHRNVLFVVIQPTHEPLETPVNLVKLEFREERGGFLAGAAAAMITRTGHVAAVCEARFIDYVRRYCEGFAAGANFVDPEVQTTVLYRSGPDELLFEDTEWGQTAAVHAIDDGADVIFAVGETTARAALAKAARLGALVIAAQSDAYEEEPGIRNRLVTSAIVDVRDGLHSLISQHLSGQLAPGTFLGNVGLAPFRQYESQISAGAITALAGIQNELTSGALDADMPFEGQ